MNKQLTILFFEDYFICSLLPNVNNWKKLRIDRQEKIPLYFYVSGDKVQNDDFAKDRYLNGDSKAYGDFYNIILDDSITFVKYKANFPCIKLLNDTLTKIKSEYQNQLLNYSASSPYEPCVVNLLFAPYIARESSKKIENYLRSEGFEINSVVNYYEAFMYEIFQKGFIPSKTKVIFAETYDDDMYFTFIDFSERIITKRNTQLKGKGVDLRIEKLAELMVEKAARATHSPIAGDPDTIASEAKNFYDKARNSVFEYGTLETVIELSDFNKKRIIIDERELQEATAADAEFLKFKFETFVSDNANISMIDKIILNGNVISNSTYIQYFERYGKQKVIKPFENLDEILSRGVFGLTDASSTKQHQSTVNVSNTGVPPLSKQNNGSFNSAPPLPPPIPKPKSLTVSPPPPPIPKSVVGVHSKPAIPPPPIPVNKSSEITAKTNAGKSNTHKPPPPPVPPAKNRRINIKLLDAGNNKNNVIEVLKNELMLDLTKAKKMAEKVPVYLLKNVDADKYNKLCNNLIGAGAKISKEPIK